MEKLTAAIDGSLNHKRLIAGVALSAGLVIYYEVFMRYSFFAKDVVLLKATSQHGITLIETLFVVAIISFLVTLVATNVVQSEIKDYVNSTKTAVTTISAKASSYYLDTTRLPESIDDLLSNSRKVPNWKGPYITEQQSLDAWGHRYILRNPCEHGAIDVVSLGADGMVGGVGNNADIGSWGGKCK